MNNQNNFLPLSKEAYAIITHPKYHKAIRQCSFFLKLNDQHKLEYLNSAPFKSGRISWC